MHAKNLTIGNLAKLSGLSRTALLYYDRLGLLRANKRSAAGYRLYTNAETERLEQICLYRQMGIPLSEIGSLLDQRGKNAPERILQRRLRALAREISILRRQQQCIVQILEHKQLQKEANVITKERWIEIMSAAGLSKQDMHNWHVQFEKMEPDAHQEFLESLGIKPEEIRAIRQQCQA